MGEEMNSKLDEKLCADYPLLFRNRHGDMRTTAMCWGFDCRDGWYNLINTLCLLLTEDYRSAKRTYEFNRDMFEKGEKGWKSEPFTQADVDAAKTKMDLAAKSVPTVDQVKEKYGSLRFYASGYTDKQRNYIHFAECMSTVTCEVCGAPGETYTDGWHETLCETHAKETGHERYDPDEEES